MDTPLNVTFESVVADPSGLTLNDAALYLNGVAAPIPIFVSQIPNTSVWKVSFTPLTSGLYSVFAYGKIQMQVRAVSKTMHASLADIEDEALGSWSWDKTTGVLTLLRRNGSPLASFDVVDNLTTASREVR